jgi:lysozyme family protein
MADFKIAFIKTMDHERGYANHPLDRGGETYRGIARKFHPTWKGWELIDSYKKSKNFESLLDNDAYLQSLVEQFYKINFWDVLSLDKLKSQLIATELFDTGVNMGHDVAANFLQSALNLLNRNQKDYKDLPVIGKIGPLTIETVNKYKNEAALVKTLNGLQFSRYRNICDHDSTQEVFFHGWLTRV